MRLRQVVRVNVSRPGGGEETLLKTARTSLRSRLLRRFVGDQYAVLVLTPVGMHVDAVEIHESKADDAFFHRSDTKNNRSDKNGCFFCCLFA